MSSNLIGSIRFYSEFRQTPELFMCACNPAVPYDNHDQLHAVKYCLTINLATNFEGGLLQ